MKATLTLIILEIMKDQIRQLAKCFTNDDFKLVLSEQYSSFIGETKLTLKSDITTKAISDALFQVSNRDSWRLEVMYQDTELLDINKGSGNLADSIDLEQLALYQGYVCIFKYTITKSIINNLYSVYDLDAFTDFLGNKSLYHFLNIIANKHEGKLVFECIGQKNIMYYSHTIAIISEHRDLPNLRSLNFKKKHLQLCETYCQWGTFRNNLIPEDLYFEGSNVLIVELFRKACLLYTLMFILDYTLIGEDKIILKLSGFKTLLYSLNTEKMKDIIIDIESLERYIDIYNWCYTGGYTSERISIARNIISLNIDIANLSLNESTLEAIKSNFKIFEHENVRQYIDVRNKISQLLIELQGKINNIVDGFVGDYKKNLLALVSFFISVIAIRVVSKGEFFTGFTPEVIILSYALIVISVLILLYSKWEFEQKEKIFNKHYEQLKARYQPLLSDDELQKAFVDSNPDIDGTHASYMKRQKKRFMFLWVATLAILAIAVSIIGFFNFFSELSICSFVKLILSCFIKNT